MNDQRKVVFEQRIDLMKEREASETIIDMRHQTIEDIVAIHIPKNAYPEQWDVVGLRDKIKTILTLDLPIEEWASQEGVAEEEIIINKADKLDNSKILARAFGVLIIVAFFCQYIDDIKVLKITPNLINFLMLGQRDPLNEFKTESFELFEALLEKLRESVTGPDERHIRYQDAYDIKPIISTEYNIEGNPKENSFIDFFASMRTRII